VSERRATRGVHEWILATHTKIDRRGGIRRRLTRQLANAAQTLQRSHGGA
jgi:hypothetical protein